MRWTAVASGWQAQCGRHKLISCVTMTYHEATAAMTDGTMRNDARKIEIMTSGTATTRAMMTSGVDTASAPAPATASGATPYLLGGWEEGGRNGIMSGREGRVAGITP